MTGEHWRLTWVDDWMYGAKLRRRTFTQTWTTSSSH
jgi:hypothetical protein